MISLITRPIQRYIDRARRLTAFRPWKPSTWILDVSDLIALFSTVSLIYRFASSTPGLWLVIIMLVGYQINKDLTKRSYRQQVFKRYKIPHVDNVSLFSGNFFQLFQPKDSYERVLQRHDELGPTFGACYGADAWIFTKDPDIIQHIFITQGHIHTDSNRLNLPIPELNNSVAQATGDRWKRLRSAIGQAFTHGRMKSDSVFSDIQSVTSIAVETIGMIPSNRRDGVNYRIADIRDLSKRFSCEVMLRIGFATNNRIDFHSASDPLIDSIDEAGTQLNNPITWMSNIFPSLTSFACRLSKLVPIYRNISYIFNVLQTNAMERANSIHNSIDKNYDRKMIDSFMESYCRKEITYEEFKGTGIYFILAGYYPTANAITCLCWLLARHQRVQEKLRSYLLQFGGVSQTLKDNYLDQVIFETCRLYPPMPSFVGRKLQHDVRIKGMTLPRGACIIPSTLAVHHDKTLWGPDASEFRPERFENAKNYHAAQFLPFSLGSRSCAGNRMAMSVIRTFISQIILQYKLDIASSTCLELRFQSPNPIQLMIEKPILIKFVNLSQADRRLSRTD